MSRPTHTAGADRRELTYLEAINEAQREELRLDEAVILMGQDTESNLFGAAKGLVEEFGRRRVRDTPISELGFTGAAIGAAMAGLRPIVDYTVATFMLVAMEQLVSQAAKARYMFGGQATVPVVFRACEYYNASLAAHHSDRPHSTFMTVPGLKIVAPSSPADAKGLLKSAIRDDDPVICFEAVTLWAHRELVPPGDHLIPLGRASVKRPGDAVTLVAIGPMVPVALEVAETLSKEDVSVEVIDPRTLVPMDWATILESVARTGRLVVADVGPRTCSAAGEIVATACEELLGQLNAPPRRVTSPDLQIPFSPALERPLYPNAASIAEAVRTTVTT